MEKSMQQLAESVSSRIFVRVLSEKNPATSKMLKLAYFGEGRTKAKNASGGHSTAAYNRVRRIAIEDGILKQVEGADEGTYEITARGQEFLTYCLNNNVDLNVKSKAQTDWETKNS